MNGIKNGNGKWQIAFWLISGLFILTLSSMGSAILTNDKDSRQRDDNLRECIYSQYSDIVQRLARIETKIAK